jgi:hypothetical protein
LLPNTRPRPKTPPGTGHLGGDTAGGGGVRHSLLPAVSRSVTVSYTLSPLRVLLPVSTVLLLLMMPPSGQAGRHRGRV